MANTIPSSDVSDQTARKPDLSVVQETPMSRGSDLNDGNKAALSGFRHFGGDSSALFYRRPPQWTHDTEKGFKHGPEHLYKDEFGHKSKFREPGVETYLSGTRFRPRELVVQFSNHGHVERNCSWNRRPIAGSVPTAMKICEWTLNPAFDPNPNRQKRVRWAGIPSFVLRTLVVALPLQLYMSFPIFVPPWDQDDADDSYLDWPGHSWKWPKFSVNPLDMSPKSRDRDILKFSSRPRLLRPRILVVQDGDDWVETELASHPNARVPYIMVSYTNAHFHTSIPEEGPDTSGPGRETLKRIAIKEARNAGVNAYWIDFQCRASPGNQDLLTADVNRFCDVVRGANRVTIALPDEKPETALAWGNRMWTLPEALLAVGDKIHIHYADSDKVKQLTKVEMAALMWNDPTKHRSNDDIEGPRLLAEHYSGVLELSRVQLMSTTLAALWARRETIPQSVSKPWQRTELAYAWMGLLRTRIDPVRDNSLFQDLAKLSLLNDSDQMMEKSICLLPKNGHADPFGVMASEDKFGTHIWDINPSCEVVGIAEEDNTVIVNDTRAIPIRWKRFPQMMFRRKPSLKKLIAEIFLRSGAWWFVFAFSLAFTYTPFWISESGFSPAEVADTTFLGLTVDVWLALAVSFFLGVGTLLSLAGPISLRVLYGGLVMKCAPHLVGFEGTIPIDKLEKLVFGNVVGRLSYGACSTPFSVDWRDDEECIAREPDWIKEPEKHEAPRLQTGNRLFTIVDTGNLSVNIIEAERPPTVALICGREGGMLRTVLCSWNYVEDCLIKQTVIRMPTEAFDMATAKGWLKLRLHQ